jgi:hypothetical protein
VLLFLAAGAPKTAFCPVTTANVIDPKPYRRENVDCAGDCAERETLIRTDAQGFPGKGQMMKSRSYLPQTCVIAAALLLLGGLGAYWPQWVGANSPEASVVPLAVIGDAITYQGYLTDRSDRPLDGAFIMRFQIYNATAGGTLLWDSGNTGIAVNNGLFESRLGITTDIFNGEELWLEQRVEGELLIPRQEILPAPMAHTLRPGAIVKGTANAIPNNYLFDVQMNNDVFAFNRGAISGQSTTGNAIYGLAQNGRAIYGQTEDGYAIYGFDGGSSANRGYAGYFYSTNGVGVYGYSGANRSHPNILAPGVYGQSNQGVGVYGRGDTSNSYSFYNEGGYFEGGKGIYARGTDSVGEQGYGARIFSDQYRGMYVQGASGWFDGYFGGNAGISTNGIINRAGATQSLVVNLGNTAIEPGDLVAMVGVAASPENSQPMLAVAKLDASNRNAVIGVAKQAVLAKSIAFENGSESIDFTPADGVIAPNGYLVVVTDGLAPAVNVASLALAAGGQIGSKLAISARGEIGLSSAEADGIVIGKVAGPIDEANGTIPLFIDID